MPNATSSDTIQVKPDGSTVIDVRKLYAKPHMREAIREMRAKTVAVPRRRRLAALRACGVPEAEIEKAGTE